MTKILRLALLSHLLEIRSGTFAITVETLKFFDKRIKMEGKMKKRIFALISAFVFLIAGFGITTISFLT